MLLTRQDRLEGVLEPPVHRGRIVDLGKHGEAQHSVPVMFHLGPDGFFGNFLPENRSGLEGIRPNSTVLLDAQTSSGPAIIRIGERDLLASRFPFLILQVLDRSDSPIRRE